MGSREGLFPFRVRQDLADPEDSRAPDRAWDLQDPLMWLNTPSCHPLMRGQEGLGRAGLEFLGNVLSWELETWIPC